MTMRTCSQCGQEAWGHTDGVHDYIDCTHCGYSGVILLRRPLSLKLDPDQDDEEDEWDDWWEDEEE